MNITATVPIIFFVPPAVFGGMLLVFAAMIAYWLIKFVVSLYTGA